MFGTAADIRLAGRLVRLTALALVLAAPAASAGTDGSPQLGRTDRFLTGPSADDPAVVALRYVRGHLDAVGLDTDDLAGLRLTERYTSIDGVTHLIWSQETRGVRAYDAYLGAHVTERGELIRLMGAPVGDLELATVAPELSAAEALGAARVDAGGSAVARRSSREGGAELVAFRSDGRDRLAWQVTALGADDVLHETVVDADDGSILLSSSLAAAANEALIWDHHPDQTKAPRVVNLGADPTWIDRSEGGTKLKGNNAYVHPWFEFTGDPMEVPQVSGDWRFPIQWFNQAECGVLGCTWDSTNYFVTRMTNRAQAATQAFYYVNRYHDHLLAAPIGFDEASRNYEFVNSSGQGVGGDAIEVVTNRSAGLRNNARFFYAAEGTAPLMELGLFDTPKDLNAADSAELVYHEYGHGLTARLIGDGAGPVLGLQTRALGEGWADWYALDFVVADGLVADGAAADVVFESYLRGNVLRTEPIDCKVGSTVAACPGAGTAGPGGYTFGDLGTIASASEHANGEIWAQTLWDLRAKIGVNAARAVVTGGLRLTPDDQTFLQARDAILQSALALGMSQTPLWQVFAARGLGVDATTAGNNSSVVVEDFTYPGGPPPDTTRPNTRVTGGPAATTTSRRATLRFNSTETGSRFQCKLDARAWATCKSPKTYTSLTRGRHTFRVRAIDQAGNVDASPATRSWRIT